MSIKKLKDGRYQVDVRPQGAEGKRIRKMFASKSEAQAYEKHVLVNYHSKAWVDKPADRRALSDLIELWWKYEGRNQKYGEKSYTNLSKICREMGKPKAFQLTRKFLLAYRSQKLQAGLKATTVNRDLALLSGMFTVLIAAEEFHSENPIREVKKLQIKNTEMAFLSDDEVNALLDQLQGDEKRVAILCLATGARWGEAANLKAEHIVGNRVTFVETKNGKKRTIPVADEIVALLQTRQSGKLFDVSYTNFRENLRTIKPNLPKGQATHVLRHTFGTHFMMNGGSIITLQRIMGHANIMQTMVYAHFAPDFLRDAISHNPLAKSVHILSIDMA
ncbi:tyrosine-type recombinase/integrase [Sodalis endosymbiont of Spalangia cameroni]|uniref:phage integrase n=1 Tax=Sodalis praecaptivus TaxID=1239307 RepID=UPI0031F854C4